MSKFKIVDSCILLDYPQILSKEPDLIIAGDVLKELDGLKLNQNPEIAFKARRAAIAISRNLTNIIFNLSLDNENKKVDDKLIELTKSYAGELITNDVYLKVKATANNIRTSGYGNDEVYTGVLYWDVLDMYSNSLQELLENNVLPPQFSMVENQYLIVKDPDGEVIKIYVYRKGKLEEVGFGSIRNKWITKITPKNPEQRCLFDALHNPNVTILYAGGAQGVGKSFLVNNLALESLYNDEINKIVYIPNNNYVKNSMELGFLPGTSFEKITPMIGTLVDLIGIDEVVRLMQDGRLEIVPIAYMRGRNFDNSIILVNEAQNLDENHVKLLIGRVGKNSRIFFDGSLQQIDSDIFKNRNGLRSILQLANSPYAENFATVRLTKVERSKTAQIADYLDELSGN